MSAADKRDAAIKKAIRLGKQSDPCNYRRAVVDVGRAAIAAYEAEKAQPVPEPTGWVTMWPVMGGGYKPCYSHGAKRPGYGPELDSLLTVYPVFAAGWADAQPACDHQWHWFGDQRSLRCSLCNKVAPPLPEPRCDCAGPECKNKPGCRLAARAEKGGT